MQKLRDFKLETLLVLFSTLVSLTKIGVLNRFPWQDLIYADFQRFNSLERFKENINSSGVLSALTSQIDFTSNFGENSLATSRVSPPV